MRDPSFFGRSAPFSSNAKYHGTTIREIGTHHSNLANAPPYRAASALTNLTMISTTARRIPRRTDRCIKIVRALPSIDNVIGTQENVTSRGFSSVVIPDKAGIQWHCETLEQASTVAWGTAPACYLPG